MNTPFLSVSRRTRMTPYTRRVEAAGLSAYTVYNHMLLATRFQSLEADYWHLCEDVQVWDVSVERQVQISGPDSHRLVQLMTPRDISKAQINQCFYVPLCDENGFILNDPIAIRSDETTWWLSIADSDILLWAKGLATGFGLDVQLCEPDIFPLAIQGPKAEELASRVFGEQVRDIRFFRGEWLEWRGTKQFVARSGWSKQGGFEVYLNDPALGEALWDDCFEKGADLNVGPGCPNGIERVESCLLSFGNDMDFGDNPFECGLDKFVSLDADVESLSLPALRKIAGNHEKQLVGLIFDEFTNFDSYRIRDNGVEVGEIRSQCWSPRYECQLAITMMNREWLGSRSSLEHEGQAASIHPIPFAKDVLESRGRAA